MIAIVCQATYLRVRSLWAPIAMHAIHNGLIAVHQRWSPLRELVEASGDVSRDVAALAAALVALPLIAITIRCWPSLNAPLGDWTASRLR